MWLGKVTALASPRVEACQPRMGREAACGHARAGFGARHGQDQDAQLAPAFLQADGYSGFGLLNEVANGQPATVTEVACWAHVRRYF